MAEKTFTNVRFQFKYDTYENWKTNNPVLKQGEIAIATIPSNQDGVQNAPSVLIKVGDGTSNYTSLKFVSGLAADVYEWAKAANKPSYKASEITGLGTYIADYVDTQMGISVDTDTQYTIVKVNDYQYKLQSKEKGGSYVDTGVVIDIPKYDDTALANRVSANETAISTLNGTGAGSVSKQVDDAINEFASKLSDDGTINTFKELVDYAAEHGEEFAELVGEVDANTNAIATLNGGDTTVGSVAKTVKDAIAAENLSQYATTSQLNTLSGTVATKANDADLAAIAKTGNIKDLVQTAGDVLIFNCGDSSF